MFGFQKVPEFADENLQWSKQEFSVLIMPLFIVPKLVSFCFFNEARVYSHVIPLLSPLEEFAFLCKCSSHLWQCTAEVVGLYLSNPLWKF